MEVIIYIIGIIIGIFIFDFLNKIFDIFYFGFKGLISTFLGCCTAGTIIVVLFGYAAKWLLIIFAILWLLGKIFKWGNKGKETENINTQQKNTNGPKTK